jgi:hypothetical protein
MAKTLELLPRNVLIEFGHVENHPQKARSVTSMVAVKVDVTGHCAVPFLMHDLF